ncbi:Uncharacterised protein [Bordetella pertussis]|nr:Uncharacterised protein [Bordetella pertussis]
MRPLPGSVVTMAIVNDGGTVSATVLLNCRLTDGLALPAASVAMTEILPRAVTSRAECTVYAPERSAVARATCPSGKVTLTVAPGSVAPDTVATPVPACSVTARIVTAGAVLSTWSVNSALAAARLPAASLADTAILPDRATSAGDAS